MFIHTILIAVLIVQIYGLFSKNGDFSGKNFCGVGTTLKKHPHPLFFFEKKSSEFGFIEKIGCITCLGLCPRI